MEQNTHYDPALPINGDANRQGADFLPRVFRTDTNAKFLSATVDQLISQGQVEKINAYIGRKTAKAFSSTDNYLSDVSDNRTNYQLEPAIVTKDQVGNVEFYSDYNDYINQLKFFNGDVSDLSVVSSQEYYAWDPKISWDKLINFREYFWLPSGPLPITIAGQSVGITSTYSVSVVNDGTGYSYVFSPDGVTRNPSLVLYRGQTYQFDIDAVGHPMVFRTSYSINSTEYTDGVTNSGIDKGIITFTVPYGSPDKLFYGSTTDVDAFGTILIETVTQSTSINVETDILGKKDCTTSNGVSLMNGMKINFSGAVLPAMYATGNWYVEGVGSAITLIPEAELVAIGSFTDNSVIPFDSEKFDSQGFDANMNYLKSPDYITINRGSVDRNPWSRSNRWFHISVIEESYRYNNIEIDIDYSMRATRPIIEFNAGYQLWNFGERAKLKVDLVDDYTTDVFSIIEGSTGYNIDGVDLIDGMRVIFTADTDIRVKNKAYIVKFVSFNGNKIINLIEADDTVPNVGESVLVTNGIAYAGSSFHFTSNGWEYSQQKTTINQSPTFDVFDIDGVSYGDTTKYVGSNFAGNKIFSYATGTVVDPVLGFPVKYRTFNNTGDLVFNFDLHLDTFTYQSVMQPVIQYTTVKLGYGYLKHNSVVGSGFENGWTIAYQNSVQPVVKQLVISQPDIQFYVLDMYENSAELTDLSVVVYLNGKKLKVTDFELYRQDGNAYVEFFTAPVIGDSVVFKTTSSAPKTDVGYYEFPSNFQNNPDNGLVSTFTLGELLDNVQSISDNHPQFYGDFPGIGNLDNLGNISRYSSKIVQNSGSIPVSMYHITHKSYNVLRSIRYARDEYAKFKRNLIRTAVDYGYDGETRVHLDLLLKQMTTGLAKTSPFALSDMVPFGPSFTFEQSVIDDSITEYPLTFDFDMGSLTNKAVLIYLNEVQLLHGIDYEFINTNFVNILCPITAGDDLKIIQYSNTDLCFVPETPTKLGLYPLYEPRIYVDDTYQTPTRVIQGHDGSITVTYDDYRDDLLLEFEKRIFNNIKVKYEETHFNVHDFISGYFRSTDVPETSLNSVLAQDFFAWNKYINGDYTNQDFFDIEANRDDSFLYNYSSMTAPDGSNLEGYWRGIYRHLYDTDRPNITPWEMLGFSMKPTWWETVYGPAPYTSDNHILWQDIETGTIREPNKSLIIKTKYARPTIMSHIPVDKIGNLLSPLDSNFANGFNFAYVTGTFKFGDCAPTENAWRRSSEYPFALLAAIVTLRPSKAFGLAFDRSRQIRDLTGQIAYNTDIGMERFSLQNIIVPSNVNSSSRVYTSGLANYISDYIISKSINMIDSYIESLGNTRVNIGCKLAGFTTKDKFKLVLDSRNPSSKGNVFIPEENYSIVLNTGSPVDVVSYSGVIVEKQADGFYIRGYDNEKPLFNYYPVYRSPSDITVNIGGVSEPFVQWTSGQFYNKGTLVKYSGAYYRCVVTTTSVTFDTKYFDLVPSLPIEGGRDIIISTRFTGNLEQLHYGARLLTVQDVVDFLLGYGKHLETSGFVFDYYDNTLQVVTNWETAAKEFAIWTTQNWSANAIISMSPAANKVEINTDRSVVDSINDEFYGYNVFKADGSQLEIDLTHYLRKNSNFNVSPINTTEGIYFIKLNMVQKEHVLILEDFTIFNDVIYDHVYGYRQDRIKVVGYRTLGWNGGFDVPGFVYDQVNVTNWQAWTDYNIGAVVKHGEFYYIADVNVPGDENFQTTLWDKLQSKPESRLIPNFNSQANQFTGFYDLETDSFDNTQQSFAQHLIGYQPRQYLANIINDEVSQYKFYQGMIRDKGTNNVFVKLFDALNTASSDSVELYEEWAIRLGRYGATDVFEELEYIIDDTKFILNPQPFELVDAIDSSMVDQVYRILPSDVYIAGSTPTQQPFAITFDEVEYTTSAGFVNLADVSLTVKTFSDLILKAVDSIGFNEYLWVGYDDTSWGVYEYNASQLIASAITSTSSGISITYAGISNIVAGEYISLTSNVVATDGFYKVTSNYNNVIVLETTISIDVTSVIPSQVVIGVFVSAKISSIDDIQVSTPHSTSMLWVDEPTWKVMKYAPVLEESRIKEVISEFSKVIAVSDTDTIMAVSNGSDVRTFVRTTPLMDYLSSQTIYSTITDNNSFGDSLAISRDGTWLAIGAPLADNGGAVLLYKSDASKVFNYIAVVDSTVISAGLSGFSTNMAFSGDKLYITHSAGVAIVNPVNQALLYHTNMVDITDMDSSETGHLIISHSHIVSILDDTLSMVHEYHATAYGMNDFGSSVAITRDGTGIAIGGDTTSTGGYQAGKVIVSSDLVNFYELYNPRVEINGKFGARVRFNRDGDALAVYASGGDQVYNTVIENVTFDNDSTKLVDISKDIGVVYRYDKMDAKFVYADQLWSSYVNGIRYGDGFVYTAMVYINDATTGEGTVHLFKPLQKSWSIYRQDTGVIDVSKIKSVFLYDRKTNDVIRYLDFIDSYQGKIPGLADQELKFKTIYDPAVYTIGTSDVVVDATSSWTEANVGRLWWDLSTCKFINPNQDNVLYKANVWNSTFPDSSVDVYEWVQSPYKPSDWDALADTEYGMTIGVSGISKYGNTVYSTSTKYDTVSKTNKILYYFWVKNKNIVPNVEFRHISANDVSRYISDPMSTGLPYITFMGANQFALFNCQQYMTAANTVLNIRYWTTDMIDVNIHSHYQIMADNDPDAKLNQLIEKKWIDSLVGMDDTGLMVPDTSLPAKLKYGVLNKPRQSMFINRTEALKQYVERINRVLIGIEISDEYDISKLYLNDEYPVIESGEYDIAVDTFNDIQYLNTSSLRQARATASVVDGKFVSINVVDSGSGYIVAPSVTINGNGSDAVLQSVIVNGQVTAIDVVHGGYDYTTNTSVSIRPFTVLVKSNETIGGKWSLYTWNSTKSAWSLLTSQQYDTRNYWDFVDWYATGYDQYTKIDVMVDYVYEIPSKNVEVGQVVRVNNHASGGWMLLKKFTDTEYNDITLGYTTIGRQNGTIQLSAGLYNYKKYNIGYDGPLYDAVYYDSQPVIELRNIIDCIRYDVFVGEYAIEYTRLFFASLRYVFSEQSTVDWAFKTSFLKAKHNVGSLTQRVTYKNDNLDDYRDYIDEVKPYRTKVREYVSSYEWYESDNTTVTDFDLPAKYNPTYGTIMPFEVLVSDNGVVDSQIPTTDPWGSAMNNVGYGIVEINIVNGGDSYTTIPTVVIDGLLSGFGTPATAVANISKGAIRSITVTNPGIGYLRTPIITLEGGTQGTQATAVAVLGNSNVRAMSVGIKFDRYQYVPSMTSIDKTEVYYGAGDKTQYTLKWPMSLNDRSVIITVGGSEVLIGEYTIENIQDTTGTYDRTLGKVTLQTPPESGAEVVISYQIDVDLLSAVDRIEFLYNPSNGMTGKDLGQLVTGVDYGGVEVSGLPFDYNPGWDSHPWTLVGWDSENVYDTDLQGGDFSIYSTAAGVKPEEIIVDGDGFVTPSTSHAPEELIPGHVVDTIDIRVHESSVGGAPIMVSKYFYTDGVTGTFDIGQPVENNSALIVLLDNVVLPQSAYHIDHLTDTVQLFNVPPIHKKLSLRSFSKNGTELVDMGNIVATGEKRYPITLSWNENLTAYVTVDGNDEQVTLYKDGYNIGIEFSNPPVIGSYIEYVLMLGTVDSFSDIRKQVVTSNVSSTIDLIFPAKYVDPLASNVLVESDGSILKAPNNIPFDVVGNNRTFVVTRYALNSLLTEDFDVIVDGAILSKTRDYNWSSSTNTLRVKRGAVKSGDTVIMSIYKDADYRIAGTTLTLFNQYRNITVSTFSNHDLLGIERYSEFVDVNTVISNSSVTVTTITGDEITDLVINVGTVVYVTNGENRIVTGDVDIEGGDLDIIPGSDLDILGEADQSVVIQTHTDDITYLRAYGFMGGVIVLDSPIESSRLVIIKNRQMLAPTIDYILLDNGMTVIFREDMVISKTDVFEIMRFNSNPVHKPFGYRIFKDILNRNHYSRIDVNHETALAKVLLATDNTIELVDVTKLSLVSGKGAVVIGGEHISFTGITGDTLTGIQRGLMGTSVNDSYPIGTMVYDLSVKQTLPYQDETLVTKWEASGDNQTIPLDFTVQATASDWYRTSIPSTHYQCDQIEVFVSGTRLCKAPVMVWDEASGAYSPAADVMVEADYSVELVRNQSGEIIGVSSVRLTNPVASGTHVLVYKKVGKRWTNGESLADSHSDIATFIKAVEVSE